MLFGCCCPRLPHRSCPQSPGRSCPGSIASLVLGGQKGTPHLAGSGSLSGCRYRAAVGRRAGDGVYPSPSWQLFILVRESPFVMLSQTPVDGSGLNPLLQDPWMVIHPPIMFTGYAAAAIPFSFAVAAMVRRRYDRWAHLAFPWALGGFLVLGTAILLGGYWAYKTLGWGGFWGWDPVENASLMPWLFGTVIIHGLHMERRKGRYRRPTLCSPACFTSPCSTAPSYTRSACWPTSRCTASSTSASRLAGWG